MRKIYGYARAVLLSLIAALAIDMLMNGDTYKSGIASVLKHRNTDTEAAGYTSAPAQSKKSKKLRLITIPSVRLPEL